MDFRSFYRQHSGADTVPDAWSTSDLCAALQERRLPTNGKLADLRAQLQLSHLSWSDASSDDVAVVTGIYS